MSTSVSQSDYSPRSGKANGDPAAEGKKTSDQAIKGLIIAGSTLLLVLVALFVIGVQGYVSGSEFSPTHFQQRDFEFYEIPLLRLQITPIWRSASTPSTANYLRQNSMIKAAPRGQPTYWHLVSISRGLHGTTAADAELLIDQLQLKANDKLHWQTWSTDHPKSAAILWPIVQRLAERELYFLVPRLFEISLADLTPVQLQSELDSHLVDQYQTLIRDTMAAGRFDLAKQLVAEAKSDYPGAVQWSAILTESIPP